MAIAAAINFSRIANGMKSLSGGMRRIKESTGKMQKSMFNVYNVKRKNFAESKTFIAKRDEMIRIKDREEEADASSTRSKIFSRPYSALARSTKGFLGRLLDFLGSLLVGWLLYNLPSIIALVTNTVSRIFKLFNLLKTFVGNLIGAFINFGNVLGAVFKNVVTLDFFDSSKRLESAIGELTGNFDLMKNAFTEGLDLLKTPMGQAQGEEPVAAPGTDYTRQVSGSEQQKTEALLSGYEGFRTKAYKDALGIPTIGYGQTRINGRAVQMGDVITKEQGVGGLRSNIQSHRARAIAQVGQSNWEKLPENVRVALTSIAYNYGSLPQRIMPAVRSGDPEAIARAIEGLGGDNGGINAWRRKDEAKFIRTGASSRADKSFLSSGPQAAQPTTPLVTPTQSKSGKGNGNLQPGDLSRVGTLSMAPDYQDWYKNSAMLNPVAAKGFLSAQQEYGKGIPINSAYRSAKHQQAIQGSYGVVAKPGTSRHGLGLALDLQPNTAPYNWFKKNGPKYGWFYAAIPGDPYHFEYRGGGVTPMRESPASAQVASAPSPPPRALAPNRQGPQINVIDNKQRDLPPLAGQGGGGGVSAPPMIPTSPTETLNNMVKRQMLLDLAYT